MTTDTGTKALEAPFARTVGTLAPIAIILASQAYATISLIPNFASAWHTSDEGAAWATTSFAIAFAFGSLLAAPLSHRLGRRGALVWSISAMAVITMLVPFTESLLSGSLVRAVQGVAAGVFSPVVYAYFGQRLPASRLATAITIISCSLGGCLVVGQVAAQLLEPVFGWQSLFWISGPLLALSAVAVHKVMLPDLPSPTAAEGSPQKAEPSAPAPRSGLLRIVPFLVGGVISLGGITSAYTAIQLYGPSGLAGDHDAMLGLRASALPALVLSVVLAPVLARIVPKWRAAGALTVCGIGLGTAALLNDSVVGMGAAMFFTMLASSSATPALVQSTGAAAGAAAGTALAVFSFVLNLCAGLGAQVPAIFGEFVPTALFLAAAYLIAALVVTLFGPTGAQPRKDKIAARGVPSEKAEPVTQPS
ncbi:MFS transporter [Streptomyces sp. NPDC001700]